MAEREHEAADALEKLKDARAIERAEWHVFTVYITILAVAICILQHGIAEGLSSVDCFN